MTLVASHKQTGEDSFLTIRYDNNNFKKKERERVSMRLTTMDIYPHL